MAEMLCGTDLSFAVQAEEQRREREEERREQDRLQMEQERLKQQFLEEKQAEKAKRAAEAGVSSCHHTAFCAKCSCMAHLQDLHNPHFQGGAKRFLIQV